MLDLVIELVPAVEHPEYWARTQFKKTCDEVATELGQHRFWMELDAPMWLAAVFDSLDNPITAARMHTELGRQRLSNM